MRLFFIQGILLCLVGVVVGIFGGWFWITVYNATPFAKASTLLGTFREPTRMSPEFVVLAVIYALISSILASILPAWQASRLDPVKAINN
jgi:ABC-type lipoprotein release transport system permease subunit